MTTATPGLRTTPVAPGVRGAALAVLVVGLGATALAAALSGSAAVVGALAGTGLVLLFFGFGAVTVNVVAARLPAASLLVALLTYTLEVVLLGLVFWALTTSGATDGTVDPDWLGLTTIAGTLAWTTGQIVGAVRARQPIFDLDGPGPASDEEVRGGGDHT